MQVGGHYSLLVTSKQYISSTNPYGTTAIKSRFVIAWKAIMTVEVASLIGSRRWSKAISLVCLASYGRLVVVHLSHLSGRPLAIQARSPESDFWWLLALHFLPLLPQKHLFQLQQDFILKLFFVLKLMQMPNFRLPVPLGSQCWKLVQAKILIDCLNLDIQIYLKFN